MPFLGLPFPSPWAVTTRLLHDAEALVQFARVAPGQIERTLQLGEDFRAIAAEFVLVAAGLDRRFEHAIAIGERLDARAAELIELGVSLRELAHRFDDRGAEIAERAGRVAETGEELIAVLPAFERAVAMATPLEGAIDRVGRLVDMLPGGAAARRRAEQAADVAASERPGAEANPEPEADAAASERRGPEANPEANPEAVARGSEATEAAQSTPQRVDPPRPAGS